MRYRFIGRMVVEPVRFKRIEREKQAEKSYSFTHHINPVRELNDMVDVMVEIESPRGMSDKQQQAFERAMNRMMRQFGKYVHEEFDSMEEQS